MTNRVKLNRDQVEVDEVTIGRPVDGGVGLLRTFDAEVNLFVDETEEEVCIGTVSGWIDWKTWAENLLDGADAISTDASTLAGGAAKWMKRNGDYADTALLVDSVFIEEEYRGNRLMGPVIDKLLDLLQLDPATTLVVTQPEPQIEGGGPYPDGAERDAAMASLLKAVRAAGFRNVRGTPVYSRG